ncbi:MAG TPA: peptidyl-dipeptidase Dcp [Gemmatimonadaceae bacterium]
MPQRSLVIAASVIAGLLTACSQKPTTSVAARQNPFFSKSTLPFEAPPFDKIQNSDYQPAIDSGMSAQIAEVRAIADNPAPPTFENTFVALEKSGALLNRVSQVFNGVTGANTNDTLQKISELEAPKFAAHQDAIFLDSALFKRAETIYDARDTLKLDPESKRLVEWDYERFVHAGARLSNADKAKLQELNKEESSLSAAFTNKLLAAAKAGALVIDDSSKLAGFNASEMQASADAAKARGLTGKWLIPLQNTTQQPSLLELNDRATREQLFNASWTRAEKADSNDTRQTIARLAQVRAQKAQLLGFPDYSAWVLENQMAKKPATVLKFVRDLVPAATARARSEGNAIQAMITKDGDSFQLEPWDWDHYSDQVRKAQFDLDENQIKPYFELNNVLQNGVFYAANQLYGLTFKERKDIPVYQPDVRVFEVFDANGTSLALFYCDYFKRDNKNGGAWMDNFVQQSRLLGQKPVVYNVANFTKPAPGQPALLTFDDVSTMFHEFGHALHGMFGDEQYAGLSGTNVARDFVEFPSQFNEHWALDPKVFAHYATNYKTGQPMPQALVDKIKKASTFNQGYALTELLSAALLDMSWHTLPASAPLEDVDKFEAQSLKDNHVDLATVPPRYRSSYFMHIWSNGYASGYYAYLWTEMLDDDAFQWFKENGGLTRANGDRFRSMVLSRGNTEDLATMYRNFRGKDPSVEPMLEDRGLKPNGK